MPTLPRDPQECLRCLRIFEDEGRNFSAAARRAEMPRSTFKRYVKRAMGLNLAEVQAEEAIYKLGYSTGTEEKTPAQAWNEHAGTFERAYSESVRKRWRTIKRPRGPFCVFQHH